MNPLQGKKILLGVTGGIAAYKTAELIRLFVTAGAEVKVVMTQAAQQFITALTLQALSNNKVYTDLWDEKNAESMLHINLARWADFLLVAPASADFLARLTYGHANDLLTNICLATTCPIFVAPAMNQQMWLNPATQQNIVTLKDRNITVLGPETGLQACGENGPGRMLDPELIFTALNTFFTDSSGKNLKVVITAGPTQEAIDPVRYLSNHSSGKMGYALASAFKMAQAEVILISGPCTITPPPVDQFVPVRSAQEMQQAVLNHIQECDIFIAAAAVADYRVENPATHKIKKAAPTLTLNLVKNPDILTTVSEQTPKPYLIGFAAETDNLLENATKKMVEKNLDMIVANTVSQDFPFHSPDNEITILKLDQEPLHLPRMSKELLATKICQLALNSINLLI